MAFLISKEKPPFSWPSIIQARPVHARPNVPLVCLNSSEVKLAIYHLKITYKPNPFGPGTKLMMALNH